MEMENNVDRLFEAKIKFPASVLASVIRNDQVMADPRRNSE